jgi:hypothetical protein
MAQLDLHNKVKTYPALTIQTIGTNTTTNGAIIDTLGYESVEFVILSGTITDGTFVPVVYESDDSGLASPIATPADFLIGTIPITDPTTPPSPIAGTVNPYADATFTAPDDNKTARIGVLNKHRYVRLSFVSTGTSSGGVLSAVAILSDPHHNVTPKDK